MNESIFLGCNCKIYTEKHLSHIEEEEAERLLADDRRPPKTSRLFRQLALPSAVEGPGGVGKEPSI